MNMPEDDGDDDFEDGEFDAELVADQILERQESEDFEGIDPFADYDVGGDW